ncbi:thiopeptide-type bacteriocin biosynthesis protein [Pedobacter borealis]|uniref:thiopeptide-type bacteriocin biosynthesis protein n=1 Tax=Pedobacter borealis TaxID=475254 RepID=UPI0004935F10|nr:thiopeptide-type bacteriocin biosynthesis protein [Pedobacter borealis]
MSTQRRFPPGSEWIYFKVYASYHIQNEILGNQIYLFVKHLYEKDLITKFIFVRYNDNDGPHLRLRFLLTNTQNYQKIVFIVHDSFCDFINERIIKLTQDTYLREIERYHENDIERLETIFSANSWEILKATSSMKKFNDDIWLNVAKLTDRLLDTLQYSLNNKIEICQLALDGLHKKLSTTSITKKKLQTFFKDNKEEYNLSLYPVLNTKNLLFEGFHSNGIEMLTSTILHRIEESERTIMILNIIHMNFNRLFPCYQNIYELVIYDFLLCSYRQQKNNPKLCQTI